MGGVIVRLAGATDAEADAETVGRLLHDFNQEFDTPGPTAKEFAARFCELLPRDDVVVALAKDGTSPVGFAFLTLRPTPYYHGSFAQLEG